MLDRQGAFIRREISERVLWSKSERPGVHTKMNCVSRFVEHKILKCRWQWPPCPKPKCWMCHWFWRLTESGWDTYWDNGPQSQIRNICVHACKVIIWNRDVLHKLIITVAGTCGVTLFRFHIIVIIFIVITHLSFAVLLDKIENKSLSDIIRLCRPPQNLASFLHFLNSPFFFSFMLSTCCTKHWFSDCCSVPVNQCTLYRPISYYISMLVVCVSLSGHATATYSQSTTSSWTTRRTHCRCTDVRSSHQTHQPRLLLSMSVCLSLCLSVCGSVFLSETVCLSVCLSVSLFHC